jgi:hypothetical protein
MVVEDREVAVVLPVGADLIDVGPSDLDRDAGDRDLPLFSARPILASLYFAARLAAPGGLPGVPCVPDLESGCKVPRPGSITSDVVEVLRRRKDGATMAEIGAAVRARRGSVLQHSVRAAVYSHLGSQGEHLFRKEGGRGGRYYLNR